jgi:Flp pilus assembly protein TadG
MTERLAAEDGAELLEYSLVFILFLTLIFGIAGFGHMLYAYHFVSNTAREATRFAAVHGSTCNNDADGGSCSTTGGPAGPGNATPISDYVSSITPPGIDSGSVSVNPSWPGTGTLCTPANLPGCPVQVEIQYQFNFIFPLIASKSLTLSSTSQMIIAH